MNTQEDNRTASLSDLSMRYDSSIPLSVQQVESVLTSAANKIDSYSEIIRLDRKKSAFMKKQLQPSQNRFRNRTRRKAQEAFNTGPFLPRTLQLHLNLRMRSKGVRPPFWLMAFMRSPL